MVASVVKQEPAFRSDRVHPVVAIVVGVMLWYLPLLLRPVQQPIAEFLQTVGLLAQSASASESRFAAGMMLRWVAAALLLVFVVFVERLPLRSLGISKPKRMDLMWAFDAGVLSAVAGIGLYLLVQGFQPDVETAAGQITSTLSLLGKIQLIANAAIVEEIFFRGLLIERITALTHRPSVGGVVSYILFVASHIAGSGVTESLTIVAVGSLIITLLYLWRRNLVLCMVAHATGNAPLLFS
jgi:membrane protease YdiL (CAAX protease family)